MLQVKFRPDSNKRGFEPEQLLVEWEALKNLESLDLIGLMTISPLDIELNQRKVLFNECRLLADKFELIDCSMGMTGDWEQAVEEGATWIRLGSLLFGARPRQVI